MYLHLGGSIVIPEENIVGIFDLETASIGKDSREFLKRLQKSGNIIDVTREMPKTFCVCANGGRQCAYISQLSTATLQKRSGAF
ncbi:MAG: DUF370 domain-containing protein [Oscillospiraceae bacterium]|jgi:hypothetical protein|nr:DUF370 domain-containing protein [Oscillospiraceae bacterium]